MNKTLSFALTAALLTLSQQVVAQVPGLDVVEEAGDSMRIKEGAFYLNGESSLKRKYFALNNPALPVALFRWFGVTVRAKEQPNRLVYRATLNLKASSSVSAVQVRCLLFDAYASFVETLRADVIADIPAGSERQEVAEWNVFPSSNAVAHFGSVCYVAKVRTAEGRVLETSQAAVIAEVAKLFGRVEEQSLTPRRESQEK